MMTSLYDDESYDNISDDIIVTSMVTSSQFSGLINRAIRARNTPKLTQMLII